MTWRFIRFGICIDVRVVVGDGITICSAIGSKTKTGSA